MAQPQQRAFPPSVVTANDLLIGDVVYMTAAGEWSRQHLDAHLFRDRESAERALTEAQAQTGRVLSVYLAGATDTPDGPRPAHFREAYRMRGPTNRFHGKQAEQDFKA